VRQTCGEAHYFKIEEAENHRCRIADAEAAGFRRAVAAYRQAFKSCPGLMTVRADDGVHLICAAQRRIGGLKDRVLVAAIKEMG
jgi:hypothetical protein